VDVDAFNYLSALISIILGLAITQVLKGFRGLMQSRTRLQTYWPTVLWAILIVVIAVQMWWSMFGLRLHENWTFLEFSAVLAQTIVVYLLAALVLPDIFGDATVNLREHYYGHRRWFFSLLVILPLASLGKNLILYGHLQHPLDLGFHLLIVLSGVSGIVIAKPRYHEFLAVFGALGTGTYIALLFTHLG
jgi:hypothetical protein